MYVTLVSTSLVREVQAAEKEAIVLTKTWAIPDLMYGETYAFIQLHGVKRDLQVRSHKQNFDLRL